MIFGKRKDREPNGPQRVATDVAWSDDQLQEALLQSSLFRVASHVTEICVNSGKPPGEVIPTYVQSYELLQDWYRGAPLKAELKKLLNELYPDPPGYDPGEPPLPRIQNVPSESAPYGCSDRGKAPNTGSL